VAVLCRRSRTQAPTAAPTNTSQAGSGTDEGEVEVSNLTLSMIHALPPAVIRDPMEPPFATVNTGTSSTRPA